MNKMKKKTILLAVAILAILFSCEKGIITDIKTNQLKHTWKLKEYRVNNVDSTSAFLAVYKDYTIDFDNEYELDSSNVGVYFETWVDTFGNPIIQNGLYEIVYYTNLKLYENGNPLLEKNYTIQRLKKDESILELKQSKLTKTYFYAFEKIN